MHRRSVYGREEAAEIIAPAGAFGDARPILEASIKEMH